jgi:putative Mn2+ efflux pump MntP
MDPLSLGLISFGLSMDAFAVAVTNGAVCKTVRAVHALKMAFAFGLFQSAMLFLGSLLGRAVSTQVTSVAYWVAFLILAAIGANMVIAGLKRREAPEARSDGMRFVTLLTLALATSIDALAVGVSLSFIGADAVLPVIVVGSVTFVLTIIGAYVGRSLGALFGKRAEVVGGVILIAIGVKILIENVLSVSG